LADPFDMLDGVLFASPMAKPVVVVPKGGSPVAATAIVEALDEAADVGGQAVEQNVLAFRLRRSEVPDQPGSGWRIEHAGYVWQVYAPATTEARGALWEVQAQRRGVAS
jgi:hypothetical protein